MKGKNKELPEFRRQRILEELRRRGVVRTVDLARSFSVSPMTIRNDLAALARKGLVEKVYGGAVAKEPIAAEPSYYEKATRNLEEKRQIAHKAAEFIQEGMAIFIGNGTTTIEIVRTIKERPVQNVKFFTNALTHAVEMAAIPGIEVYVIGGRLRGISYAMVGPLAEKTLDGIYFDIVFLGANGVTLKHGVTIPSVEEARTAQLVASLGRKIIVVIDHSKLGVVTHARIINLLDTNLLEKLIIITNKFASEYHVKALQEAGIEVILV
ncbi:MAG: DeoR/GlpR family DNA-binding transcription regulator [Thermosphaera sp.]